MARRKSPWSSTLLGVLVVVIGVLLFLGLFLFNMRDGVFREHVAIRTDFRTINGLRKDSRVMLAGVEVGTVQAIDFVTRRYECDPLSEDLGRHGTGRSNTCDASMFCAPNQLCAELEHYATKSLHSPCLSDDDCREDEACVTPEFRRRFKDVYWSGPQGVCARFTVDHHRVQVTMQFPADALDAMGADSIATIGSSGVLGDQQVNVTPGSRGLLVDGGEIQSELSFNEQIAEFRDRFGGLSDKLDQSLSAISSAFTELNDAHAVEAAMKTLTQVDHETTEIIAGRGTLGGLVHDDAYLRDVAIALEKSRNTADYVDGIVADANAKLTDIDRETEPRVAELRKDVGEVRAKLDALDPKSSSSVARLLRDPSGEVLASLRTSLTNVRTIGRGFLHAADTIERGEGSVGSLISDPAVYDGLGRTVLKIENDWRVKLLLWLLRR